MSYAIFGSHRHPANEVNMVRMDVRHKLGPRNRRLSKVLTLYLWGEVQETGAALLANIAALRDAYRFDYQDFRYYMDDGTETIHGLINSNSMSGVKILQRSWPQGDHAELATKRTFSITLQAEYADFDDQVVRWSETIQLIGDCGRRYEVIETLAGPIPVLTALKTSQKMLQYGSSVGFQGYAEPFGPIDPAFCHGDQIVIYRGSPVCAGQHYVNFPMRWMFPHTFATPQDPLPTTL